METIFAGNIEVQVLRNGKEVARVVRPLRQTPSGPVVRYKRRLWPLRNNAINLNGKPIEESDGLIEQETTGAKVPAAVPPNVGAEPAQVLVCEEPARDVSSTDQAQERVLKAGPEQRLLVDAGPGTGKTHTACLKVAALIREHDIPPSRIWMISFTRTAVHEIRSRLEVLLPDRSEASAVRIATLDSLAWTIHSGFSGSATLTGSYDDNISETLAKIRSSDEVRDEFEKIGHVIVDEAQDIVGVRAELVLAIIDTVAPECGVTVFADQAQAIYGWTEDEENSTSEKISLLGELEDREFQAVSLDDVHRTGSPSLLQIFRDVRRKVLDSGAPLVRGPEIRLDIERLADAKIGPANGLNFSALPSNALVLFRQRSDVLIASSYNQTTPHRLRLSGLPVRTLPWLALMLWDHVDRRLSKDAFDRLWEERVPERTGTPSSSAAWSLLFETAGMSANVIDLHRLRSILGRSNPPAPFTSPDYGDTGPIIGTIHASKGREAEEVFLYLPPQPESEEECTDLDEEIRVMFVGATRARKKLSVGNSSGKRPRNVDGRFWKNVRKDRVQIEIGRASDIYAAGLVGKATFREASDALNAQRFLLDHPVVEGLGAYTERDIGWRFAIQTRAKQRIGAFSDRVSADVKEIASRCNSWPPPRFLPHIRSVGLRSIALRTDDPDLDNLHEPWRSSGFVLAPMLLGICATKLKS